MNSMEQLTILTVAGPGDEPFVRANIEFTKAQNPNANFHFVVIDNGLTGPQGMGILGELDATVLPGVAQSPDKPKNCRGSYQHSEALNFYLRNNDITSQYLLVLDPDFYVVAPDWIRSVIRYMRDSGLAFFGTPWHPKWYSKYRNFPSVHCMFIDLKQVDAGGLDFVPDLVSRNEAVERRKTKLYPSLEWKDSSRASTAPTGALAMTTENAPVPRQWWLLLGHMIVYSTQALAAGYRESGTALPRGFKLLLRILRLPRKLRSLFGVLVSLTINRRFINVSHDTGFQIQRRFGGSGLGIGLVQPVVHYHEDFVAAKHLRFRLGRVIESILPDRWSYVPKQADYFVDQGFSYYGLPDVTHHKWEEFIWQGAPFGFHLRRFNKAQRDVQLELAEIVRVTTAATKPPVATGEGAAGTAPTTATIMDVAEEC